MQLVSVTSPDLLRFLGRDKVNRAIPVVVMQCWSQIQDMHSSLCVIFQACVTVWVYVCVIIELQLEPHIQLEPYLRPYICCFNGHLPYILLGTEPGQMWMMCSLSKQNILLSEMWQRLSLLFPKRLQSSAVYVLRSVLDKDWHGLSQNPKPNSKPNPKLCSLEGR